MHPFSRWLAAPLTVLIAGDHYLLGHGLGALLRKEGLHAAVSDPPADAQSVIDEAVAAEADLVVLDLDLERLRPATDLITTLRAKGVHVIVLTGRRARTAEAAAIQAGAACSVAKSAPFQKLLDSIRDLVEPR